MRTAFSKISLCLALLVLTSCQSAPILSKRDPAATPRRTVFVHLFEWTWNDIARECTEFLGPKGYAAVQVSPPNEHVVLDQFQWYQRYQPVSYKIESRGGTRAEFKKMVQACRAANVDIYVDAVINHMSAVVEDGQTRTGFAGSKYSKFAYADMYGYNDFHHCGRNGNDDIQQKSYGDRYEVQNCQLEHLADLNTSSSYVQNRIADYIKDLYSLGVKGLRIDAAKHMAAEDLRAIRRLIPQDMFIFQEVIDQGSGEAVRSSEYVDIGHVTEFRYSLDVSRIFKNGKLAWFNGEHQLGLDGERGWGYIPDRKAIVFIDNHDNERGTGGGGEVLTFKEPQLHELASVFMLAWPYGYPSVMSSYAFPNTKSGRDSGPPSDQKGRTQSVFMGGSANCLMQKAAESGWVCEHRWPRIANMVEFKNATSDQFFIANWWTNGNNQIAFSRGNLGFVVINNESQPVSRQWQTGLPPGTYCNVVEAADLERDCRDHELKVDTNGNLSAQVKEKSSLAIHVGRRHD